MVMFNTGTNLAMNYDDDLLRRPLTVDSSSLPQGSIPGYNLPASAERKEPIASTGDPKDDEINRMFHAMAATDTPQKKPEMGKLGLGILAAIAALSLARGKQRDYGLLGKEDRSREGADLVGATMGSYQSGLDKQNEGIAAKNKMGRSLLMNQILNAQKFKQAKEIAGINAQSRENVAKTRADAAKKVADVRASIVKSQQAGKPLTTDQLFAAKIFKANQDGLMTDDEVIEKISGLKLGTQSALAQGMGIHVANPFADPFGNQQADGDPVFK